MTDRIHPERAVATPIDCDRFDALLADHLENALPAELRAAADAHLATCDRCRSLTDDLLAITRDAAALGPIEPARDLWDGIAARIAAPVVPIGRTGEQAIAPLRVAHAPTASAPAHPAARDRFALSRRWLAAAASVLVATSVGSTYVAMRVASSGAPRAVASAPAARPGPTRAPEAPGAVPNAGPRVASAPDPSSPSDAGLARGRQRVAEGAVAHGADARLADARLAADGAAAVYAPAVRTYDREIATLRAALQQRADLDSSTVVVLERSLRVIDQAIAESRRALQRDPASRLLGDQLTRALDRKVELLRTAVLLPSRS